MRIAARIVFAVMIGCGSRSPTPLGQDAMAPDAPSVMTPDAPKPPIDDPCFPDPGPGHRVYTCNGIAFDVEVPAACVLELLAHDYSSNAQVPFVSASKLQGHCYPGSADPGNQPGQLFSFRCEQPAAFVWGVEVIEFFVAHPR